MIGEQRLRFGSSAIANGQKKWAFFANRRKTFVLAACLVATFTKSPSMSARADQIKPTHTWAVAAVLTNKQYTGSGIFLTPDMVITAAHVAGGWTGDIQVHIAGADLPAMLVKTGNFEDVDLALFSVDRQKIPERIQQIEASLCVAAAWPGDPVIVVDREWISRSRIVSPMILQPPYRGKFATLIADVATTGNSGSGVFDPTHECLLGIMSRKFIRAGVDLAKYFVPASEIREFIPAEMRGEMLMK
jgi:Trypsin-like peptidase domain